MKKTSPLPQEPPSLEMRAHLAAERVNRAMAARDAGRARVTDAQGVLDAARTQQRQAEAAGNVAGVKAAEAAVAEHDREYRMATAALETAEQEFQAALDELRSLEEELRQQRGRREVEELTRLASEADLEAERANLRMLQKNAEGRELRNRLRELQEFGGHLAAGGLDDVRQRLKHQLVNDPRYQDPRRLSEIEISLS